MGLFNFIKGAAKSAGSSLLGAAKESAGDFIQQGIGSLFGGGEQQAAPAPSAAAGGADVGALAPGAVSQNFMGGDAGGGLGGILAMLGGGGGGGLGALLGMLG